MTLVFTQEPNPDANTIKAIADGLIAYNTSAVGPHNYQTLCLVGRDSSGNINAGLKGYSLYNWLFVEWLWVAEAFRKHGYGSNLLSQAEHIAKERSCTGIYLDTFSFQAPQFYAKHGYQEFGRINNFPMGHDRIFLYKHLDES
jgi:GNAT superfamily N-acetyltransferase